MPTIVQYIKDSDEWVFGEYAVLSEESENNITINNIINRLGNKEYIDINQQSISIATILSMFIKEILTNIKNINPKSTVDAIVCAVPSYMTEESKEGILVAFEKAGYSDKLIGINSEIECIMSKEYYNKTDIKEKIIMLDFGSSSIKGGVYEINLKDKNLEAKTLSTLFDTKICIKKIDELIENLFSNYYSTNMNVDKKFFSKEIKKQIQIFVYQHKDMLFTSDIGEKPIRLYLNFAFPPFQINVTKQEIDKLLEPVIKEFKKYIQSLLQKNIYTEEVIDKSSIHKVICYGGGFEMLWARRLIAEMFETSEIILDKNTKGAVVKGASIIAYNQLSDTKQLELTIDDKQKINYDIGILIKNKDSTKFVPIIKRNSFWWSSRKPTHVIFNGDESQVISINMYMRNINNDLRVLETIELEGLKNIKRGATKISISVDSINFEEIAITFKDYGFGELHQSSGFIKEAVLKI
jgi:molecular chaperone DnaK (HSP70)